MTDPKPSLRKPFGVLLLILLIAIYALVAVAVADPVARLPVLVQLPIWIVLGIGATVILAYMCVQADRREGPFVQAVPIAFVSALVTSAILVVAFLDSPYSDWTGSLQPDEMRVTLTLIDDGHSAPCDGSGSPT